MMLLSTSIPVWMLVEMPYFNAKNQRMERDAGVPGKTASDLG
jgi:hypothetical protein